MGRYFDPPQKLLNGEVGTEIPVGSGIHHLDPEARWQHYITIARKRGGHLYATVITGLFPVAMCVDRQHDFVYAIRSNTASGMSSVRYFVLTPEEHALSA